MPYVYRNLCIWHPPKSAGSFLWHACHCLKVPLERLGEQHAVVSKVPTWKDYSYHAVLKRDPVEWYRSAWRWLRRHGNVVNPHLYDFFGMGPPEHWGDFSQFVVQWCGTYSAILRAYSPPRCVYLRTERVRDDLAVFLRVAGVEFDADLLRRIKPINITTHEPPPEVSPELAELIRESESWH